jgi:hypothetical protein
VEEDLSNVADWISTEWGSLSTEVGSEWDTAKAALVGFPSFIEVVLVLVLLIVLGALAVEFFAPRLLGV